MVYAHNLSAWQTEAAEMQFQTSSRLQNEIQASLTYDGYLICVLLNLCSLQFLCALEEQVERLWHSVPRRPQHSTVNLTAFAECSVSAASLTAQVTLAHTMLFISFGTATHGVPEFIQRVLGCCVSSLQLITGSVAVKHRVCLSLWSHEFSSNPQDDSLG